MRPLEREPELAAAPTNCPFCRSSSIAATTSEKVDASTYWRCQACGEMWNLGRLRAQPNRYDGGGGQRWR